MVWTIAPVSMLAGCQQDLRQQSSFFGTTQGEAWTILCAAFNGRGSGPAAREIATGLRKTPGLDAEDVMVIYDDDQAHVVYGRYIRKIDPHTRERTVPKELTSDLERIRGLRDHDGRNLFLGARFIPMPRPDVGKASWDLRNVNAEYTLQVAVYYNSEGIPDRKLAAVEKVKQLRAEGLEAYYYHGESQSIVTVGRFGKDAVEPLRQSRTHNQHAVAAYSDKVRNLQERPHCQYNLTNDDIWYNKDMSGKDVPVASMLVRVPD